MECPKSSTCAVLEAASRRRRWRANSLFPIVPAARSGLGPSVASTPSAGAKLDAPGPQQSEAALQQRFLSAKR